MDAIGSPDEAGSKTSRWRHRVFPVLALLAVIGIVASIFLLYQAHPERVSQLRHYGYLGVFLISLILNATVILPAGTIVMIAVLGATLPSATLVGLAGGAGAAIGEITGYVAGYSGRTIVRQQMTYARLERWVNKWGTTTIFFMSAVPFIFDLVGIAAGAMRLSFWRFLVAAWMGRSLLYIGIAMAGARGWEVILHYLGR